MSSASTSACPAVRPKFSREEGFRRELRRRVDAYFADSGRSRNADWRMYLQTLVLLLWFGASYGLLVFVAATWWQAIPLAASLALSIAGIGFGIMHDANHGAYSRRNSVNRILERTLDLLGASSYMWRWKHNIFHHVYTNIDGVDHDIDLTPFARLTPTQPRHWYHRFQHIYMWPLYGFTVYHMHYVEDFAQLWSGRIGRHRFPRPHAERTIELFLSKAVVLAWSLALPMLFHPWWLVLGFYLALWLAVGLILGVVFQIAHAGEAVVFAKLAPGAVEFPREWSIHQVEATVDFAQQDRILTWYLGGLNFQIEHHLYPLVCHIHYPRIASIVREVCAEHGVRYTAHTGLFAAVSSHGRWLRQMGREPT